MVGYLFAGQGAQYIGMGKDLYQAFPESKKIFDSAEETLGFDLKRPCFEGPQDLLRPTSISQPAILTVSIAAFEAFRARSSVIAVLAAGLSLGEYGALVAAGSLSFTDALRLVRQRGRIMDEASRRSPGEMAAVLDLPLKEVREICLKTKAEIANINCPGQVVISGKVKAVDEAADLCVQAGAKRVIKLEVSGGFHSSLMRQASGEFEKILQNTQIIAPVIPVVSNYTAEAQHSAEQIKKNLVCQMYSAVRWEDSMRFMLSQGVSNFFEFGPGRVLKGLMRRINPEAQVVTVEKKEDVLSLS